MSTGDVVASVVIVVKNDRRLERLIERLSLSACRWPAETVVVDASQGKLDDIRDRHPGVRWIAFEPPAGRDITIAIQRNEGIRAARGEVIAFIDADCVPADGWLERLVAPLVEDGETMAAGPIKSFEGRSIHDSQWEYDSPPRYVAHAPTMNLAFRRETALANDGFDESLRFGSDVDFSWRLGAAGERIRYVPDALVLHDWGDLRANVRRAFLYGEARCRVYKKHRSHWRRLLTEDSVYLAYAIFLLGLPLTRWTRAYPLLLMLPLAKNARRRPLAVTGSNLITGLGFMREAIRPPRRRG